MTAPLVKICGFKSAENAAKVVEAGADWIGLNFYPGSKRFIEDAQAQDIARACREARQDVVLVGVFVNATPERVAELRKQLALDYVQLHGDETPQRCKQFGENLIIARGVGSHEEATALLGFQAETVLVDTPTPLRGGSGEVGNWDLAKHVAAQHPRVLLAGGLDPENVAAAVRAVKPFAVDVASGVEADAGVKDLDKVRAFIDNARGAA